MAAACRTSLDVRRAFNQTHPLMKLEFQALLFTSQHMYTSIFDERTCGIPCMPKCRLANTSARGHAHVRTCMGRSFIHSHPYPCMSSLLSTLVCKSVRMAVVHIFRPILYIGITCHCAHITNACMFLPLRAHVFAHVDIHLLIYMPVSSSLHDRIRD